MFWPIFISAVSFWGVALAGGLYYGRRYVRAIEAQRGNAAEIAELRERIAELESGVVERPALSAGTRSGETPRIG